MASCTGKDNIPDHWLCPVCLEIPEKEVYQCRDGHLLCNICYFQVIDAVCPQCRKPLDRDNPIRNRMMEEVFAGFKVNCRFKSNGCDKKLSKKSFEKHEVLCSYDFNKFGKFIKICGKIGFPNCDFKCNNGNAKETVNHLVSKHGCILTTSESYQMELTSFKESAKREGIRLHFWTPIITDLKEQKCYLLTLAILNKADACFNWLSIFLPHPEHLQGSLVEMEYKVKTGEILPFTAWTGRTLSLSEASKHLPNFSFVIFSLPFIQCCSKEGSLLIDCNVIIRRHGVAATRERKNTQSFICNRNILSVSSVEITKPQTLKVPVRFDRNGGSYAATNFRDELLKDFLSNRNNVLVSTNNLFEGKKPKYLTVDDVKWLKMDLVFLTAQYGSVETLKYLIEKGVDFNIVDDTGTPPLRFTMSDKDKRIGLEKAKLLIDLGIADVHALNDKKCSALHHTAWFGNNEAVEYLLQKGCDVNAKDCDGWTPLYFAALHDIEQEGLQIAKTLLTNGADLSIKDIEDKNALDFAIRRGKNKIAQLLIKSKTHQSN